MNDAITPPEKTSFSFARLIPLLILIAGLVAFFALGLNRYVSFSVLRENREFLLTWVRNQVNAMLAISSQSACGKSRRVNNLLKTKSAPISLWFAFSHTIPNCTTT